LYEYIRLNILRISSVLSSCCQIWPNPQNYRFSLLHSVYITGFLQRCSAHARKGVSSNNILKLMAKINGSVANQDQIESTYFERNGPFPKEIRLFFLSKV